MAPPMSTRVPWTRAARAAAWLACAAAWACQGASADDSANGAVTSSTSGGGPTTPNAMFVPKAAGACPGLADGKATFKPQGIAPRAVRLTVGAAGKHGPLVFVWHGAGGDPSEAGAVLGSAAVSA